MEVVEEPPLVSDVAESGKLNNTSDEVDNSVDTSIDVDVCLKSNGDAELKQYVEDTPQPSTIEIPVKESEGNVPASKPSDDTPSEDKPTEDKPTENVEIVTTVIEEEVVETPIVEEEEKAPEVVNTTETTETPVTVKVENVSVRNESVIEETVVEVDGIIMETIEDNVTFETEVLVESNVMDIEEHLDKTTNDDTNNAILTDFSQNIDLSEVLRSSDVTNNVENNNCEQEVFNKEELLDILEGNDSDQVESRKIISENFPEDSKKLEEQLALQQLSRLQSKKSKTKKTIEKKTPKKRLSRNEDGAKKEASKKDSSKQENDKVAEVKSKEEKSNEDKPKIDVSKEESIVNELVKDWEDDEHVENEDTRKLRKSTEKSTKSQDANISKPELEQSHNDMSIDESSTPKTGEESQPHRRFGRVIKKKVIFDPDNPDTFTKTKTIKKEEKDHSPPKKSKTDQSSLRAKSKSPVSKLQWKKPNPKNSKQSYKRLTEIDKLLMDEGAVNMICQLTTEAPKGKMNMKSKAEFIKKIQSNTPDTKEKKFRERKKEIKTEDGEPKKITGGKHRLSLSSSVKSPSVSEDFEAHSADDSIIYRRHSSSSYSSSCMSPRRLSDVENNTKDPASVPQTATPDTPALNKSTLSNNTSATLEVFLTDNTSTPTKEIMNKRDCLSIKEKLNTKLSQALNKRKRESGKAEKPSKLKKVSADSPTITVLNDNKFVYVNYKDNVAELCIGKSGSLYTLQMLQELNNLLKNINSMENVNVTLILSEGEILSSGIDLKSILIEEQRLDQAKDIADAVKCLQATLVQHSKLTCLGVIGKCEGFSLGLAALCDVVIASEGASFSMLEPNKILVQPGAAALRGSALPRNLLNDIILFGRRLSASEALNSGLVSRVIWPERFVEQMRSIAKDVATQPAENLKMKKQLLNLNRTSESSILSYIETEKNLLVNYWTSSEGLQTLISIFTNSG